MQFEIGPRDLFHVLSPVGCLVEALSTALLFTAIVGCALAALP